MNMSEPTRFQKLRGELRRDEPMARHTSWRTGGRADRFYAPADLLDLGEFLRQLPETEPLLFVGLGSNLLVRDGGWRGTVVLMHAASRRPEMRDGRIYAEAGVASPKVARFAALQGLEGAEFLAGVPGTVGGALAMNAGCYGGETWRHVARVEMLSLDGRFAVRTPDEFAIGYRSVTERDGSPPAGIFTAAWFRFPLGDGELARQRIRSLLATRIATQPLSLPNAGSVFRNPPGDHAARLIEGAGLKGHRIGGARVSEMHANFIVNDGTASAADIEQLIGYVMATVERVHGVQLKPEVRIVGEARV
jgi:UDP-N-acetylmuramate dehydrogenase